MQIISPKGEAIMYTGCIFAFADDFNIKSLRTGGGGWQIYLSPQLIYSNIYPNTES